MRILTACLFLATGTPLAAQTVEDRYQAAVQARLGGDSAGAVRLLNALVADEPRNADAQLQLGLAQLSLGALGEAEAAFRRTLSIAPDYADARIGLARVAQRRGDLKGARAELDSVDLANIEAAEMRRQLNPAQEKPGYRWRADLDGGYSRLSGPQPDWKEASARLAYIVSPGTEVSAGAEFARRFNRDDIFGEIRLDRRVSPGTSFNVRAGGTPNADFRPKWQIGAGADFRLAPGPRATVLTIDAAQARYRSGDIQTLTPGIDQYMAGGRVWLSARWINIFQDGDHQDGWLGRATFQANEKLRLFAGAADAPDTDEGVVVETFGVFGGVSYDVSDRMNIRASLAHEDRKTGADRLNFGLGAGWKF